MSSASKTKEKSAKLPKSTKKTSSKLVKKTTNKNMYGGDEINRCMEGAILDQMKNGTCWYMSILHALFFSKGTREVLEIIKNENESNMKTVLERPLFETLYSFRDNSNIGELTQAKLILGDVCRNIIPVLKTSCGINNASKDKSEKFKNQMRYYHTQEDDFEIMTTSFSVCSKNVNVIKDGAHVASFLNDILYFLGFRQNDCIYIGIKNYEEKYLLDIEERFLPTILKKQNNWDARDIPLLIIGSYSPLQNLPEILRIKLNDEDKYVDFILDSCVLTNMVEESDNVGHAITGVTCPYHEDVKSSNRYVLNSWKEFPITHIDWYNKDFILDVKTNKLEAKNVKTDDSQLLYKKTAERTLFYVRKDLVDKSTIRYGYKGNNYSLYGDDLLEDLDRRLSRF